MTSRFHEAASQILGSYTKRYYEELPRAFSSQPFAMRVDALKIAYSRMTLNEQLNIRARTAAYLSTWYPTQRPLAYAEVLTMLAEVETNGIPAAWSTAK